jgi:hypothetical protein
MPRKSLATVSSSETARSTVALAADSLSASRVTRTATRNLSNAPLVLLRVSAESAHRRIGIVEELDQFVGVPPFG